MRRIPVAVWILAPLALGLLYAAAHALLAPKPTLASLPPEDAILVHRIRGLDMLDLTSPGPRGPGQKPPREALGVDRNNVGLIGVNHEAPVHLVLMPRTLGLDSTMAIFELQDADAFEREFMRTDFLERGLIRRAQYLQIQGRYAAVGPNRDATRRLGTGGITAEDLGEDWAMAADIPRLAEHAAQLAKHYPWRGVLTAIGLDVEAARMQIDPKTRAMRAFLPGDKRLQRVHDTWKTVRLWAWHNQKKLRVDLEPTVGSAVAAALEALPTEDAMHQEGADVFAVTPQPPSSAQAWLHMPQGAHTRAMAHLLLSSGVRFVAEKDGVDPLGGLGKAQSGLLLWAERGLGTGYAITVGVASGKTLLPVLAPFLPLPEDGSGAVPLPAGMAPLTVGDTTTDRKVPAGSVEMRRLPGAELITFGPSAKEAAEGFVAAAAANTLQFPQDTGPTWRDSGDLRPVARFFLGQQRAEMVLGRALRPGGFLAMLRGGDIHGRVEVVDGVVRLTAWVVR